MRRILSFSLVFLLFLVCVSGEICEDNIEPFLNCSVVTPSLVCGSYTYEVYGNNQSLVDSGSLSVWSGDVYYFNFSRDVGEYVVKLCDGTIGYYFVNYNNLRVFGESFNWLAIILVFVSISVACLWISKKITNVDLELYKIALFFFGMINTFVLVSITLFISSGSAIKNFNDYFNVYVVVCLVMVALFILYYVVYLVMKTIKSADNV